MKLSALSVLTLVLPFAVVRPAAAQAPPESYVVVQGEDCGDVARKLWADPRAGLEELHALNPQLGALPHVLKGGQVLKVPSHDADAKIAFVRNRVDAFTPAQHPAHADEPLRRGHRVSTLDAAAAEVVFLDRSRLELGEHTLVVILGGSSRQAVKKGTIEDTTLVRGSLRAHLAELSNGDAPDYLDDEAKPPNLRVATPKAKVSAAPGEVQVSVDASTTTRLAVYRGKGNLAASGKAVDVPAGFGSKASGAKPPEEPRPLPAAPTWLSPLPRAVFARGDKADAVGVYAAGMGIGPAAARWHVELARDAEFHDVITDTRVPVQITRLEARGLPVGEYWARVSAIDADQFEGPWSAIGRISIARVELTRGAPPPEGHRARVAIPPGWTCGLDGDPMTITDGPIELLPARPHTVKCTPELDARGAAAEAAFTVQESAPLVARIDFDPPSSDQFNVRRRAVIRLTDGSGAPIAGARVTATVAEGALTATEQKRRAKWEYVRPAGLESAGASLGPIVELEERGAYATKIEWGKPDWGKTEPHVTIRVEVNGVERFEVPIPVAP